jgi:hypothetical protein
MMHQLAADGALAASALILTDGAQLLLPAISKIITPFRSSNLGMTAPELSNFRGVIVPCRAIYGHLLSYRTL